MPKCDVYLRAHVRGTKKKVKSKLYSFRRLTSQGDFSVTDFSIAMLGETKKLLSHTTLIVVSIFLPASEPFEHRAPLVATATKCDGESCFHFRLLSQTPKSSGWSRTPGRREDTHRLDRLFLAAHGDIPHCVDAVFSGSVGLTNGRKHPQ